MYIILIIFVLKIFLLQMMQWTGGLTVAQAGSGNEVIRIFTDHHTLIDLVILDFIMPDKSGEETFDALRE